MTTETDLREAFRAAEQLAPDPGPVADRIRAGVRARRRHRTAAVAAVAVATAAAVAVPSVLLTRPGGGPAPASPAVSTTAPGSAPSSTRPAVPAIRFDALAVPFSVGWLPAGWYADGMLRTGPGLAERSYESRGVAGELVVRMWDVRVSGRSANDPPAGGPVVRKHLSRDVWLTAAGTAPAAELRRVLESVQPVEPRRLTFPFRLTWLPSGYQVTSAGSGVHHWYGTGSGVDRLAAPPGLDAGISLDPGGVRSSDPAVGTALTVDVSSEDGMWTDKGVRPNGTLLGRPVRYREFQGFTELHVFGLRGMHVLVSAAAADRATLERVVRGLRMVDSPDRPAGWTDRPLP